MSFFAKIKQFMGIGTLDVKVHMTPNFRPTDEAVGGKLHITAKSDQSILSILFELHEDFETGRGEEKKERRFTLGTQRLNQPFEMKTGETKTVDFSVPFQLLKSNNDQLKERGGMLGAVGKMGAWAANEKSTYSLRATVDVKGASLDPNDTVELKMMK